MFLRAYIFITFILFFAQTTVLAAMPEADVGSFSLPSQSGSTKSLKAQLDERLFYSPPQPWRIPPIPMRVRGEGVAIYYLIPYARVEGILPKELKPNPGSGKIWFRVDLINWKQLLIKKENGEEVKVKPFLQLDYRFEVTYNGRKGSYPLRMQMNKDYAVLWARKYGQYPAFKIKVAYSNFSPFIHLFQFRNTELATAVVEATPLQGIGANIQKIFNRREDILMWQGEGWDFIWDEKLKSVNPVKRKFNVEVSNASLDTILLRDPVEWQILSKQEVSAPEKVLILESITGEWFGQ